MTLSPTDMQQGQNFSFGLGCMDGRCNHARLDNSSHHGRSYLDLACAPGMDGILSGRMKGVIDFDLSSKGGPEKAPFDCDAALANAKTQALIAYYLHEARHFVVEGHDQCAGNPVSREDHIEDIRTGVSLIREWFAFDPSVTVEGIFVAQDAAGKWVGEAVHDIGLLEAQAGQTLHEDAEAA